MTLPTKAAIWAVILLVAALIMSAMNASDGASIGVITGLSGAAWASLQSDAGCRRNCLQ